MDTKHRTYEIFNVILKELKIYIENGEEQQINRFLSEINSLHFIKFLVTIESEFDFQFDDNYLRIGSFRDIDEICLYIDNKLNEKILNDN
ncbi:MAG: hypothetical protein FWE14_00180 [Lachnospiraceae bacterium]|nr:hypothetical protein [Lachnospiraceae bacterium]